MKRLFALAIAFVLNVPSFAQTADEIVSKDEGGIIHLSEVVQVPNKNKDALYSNCILWISENINTPKDAIQTDNQQAGLITVKSKLILTEDDWWDFVLTIQLKDGRYKYDISNIYHRMSETMKRIMAGIASERPIEAELSIHTNEKIYNRFKPTIDSLKKKMAENNDW